ncbi:acetolactate synthase 2 small subunit [Gilliamella sp. B2911]|uniref:acetolactate synthase 2 small subunit n=1 Tax=Gilliamella sp. B2911 TaxID=2817980 RepID=UPI002269879A|nr:acetolactate synthase 2 small subunit [Gilliamella sp. B2911]MCX8663531.1 acetolactate synthase 2 small subunit [Gilliamella sp. B2911]
MNQKATHQFTITANDKLGSLERILRVVRHRGGHIEQMQMQSIDNQLFTLTLTLTTERTLSSLQNQITKLEDVITIA